MHLTPKDKTMLSTNDLAKRYNVHRATIFRWRELGLLATPLQLGAQVVRWRENDIAKHEQWLIDRANAAKAGRDPESVPEPDYSLPVTTDAHSMARERLAATFEDPSTMEPWIETITDELTQLAAESAILASRSLPGQLSDASCKRLKKALPPEVLEELLEELPPANAARLTEILN